MHQLETLLGERLSGGLSRKSIVSAGKWALKYRKLGQPFPGDWSFRRHSWLEAMHNSQADHNVGQKAAQMGFTETVLNFCLFYIDIHGVDCLYVLPSKTPDASDFSASRFDAALDLSSHLKNLFSDVKNVGHKRAGNTNLYIRGAKSRSGLKSIPVGVIILDERDEMNQANIPLAKERQSGYTIKKLWEISTPTIDGFGINSSFTVSSQNHFYFKCPGCSRLVNLTFPESVEIIGESFNDPRLKESYYKCNQCSVKLPHEDKLNWLSPQNTEWVTEYAGRGIIGWGISQMYSPTIPAHLLLESYFRAQFNPADEQEFYNSKLGLPHIVEGARINEKDFDSCIGDYRTKYSNDTGLVTMGVDVGNYLHFVIEKWTVPANAIDINAQSIPKTLVVGKCLHFEELDVLMQKYGISFCVIDMQPERRKAFEFAMRHWGRVRLCQYGRGMQGKSLHLSSENEMLVTVDRTSWLDMSQGRFKTRRILLPLDIPHEYRAHILAIVRIYEKDADGNPVGKYVKSGSNADHYAHSRNYSEIALPLAAKISQASNIIR